MERISLEEFERAPERYDATVSQDPFVDRFCSSSAWILPCHAAFSPEAPVHAFRGEHGEAVFAASEALDGLRVLQPLEATWGFACPVPSKDPVAHARDVASLFRGLAAAWDLLVICGLSRGSEPLEALLAAFGPRHRLGVAGTCARQVADLGAGLPAWLSRRSPQFRRTLQRARAKVERAEVSFELLRPTDEDEALRVHDRSLAVERRSWKGLQGVGVEAGSMRELYRGMAPRLARGGMLRALFARREGRDVAYLLGAMHERRFRGLQFSFDAELAALGLGNVVQLSAMEAAAAEGADEYDLGSDVPYKRRWADRTDETVNLLILRR